jgi:SAM-dependent methyltransferase
VSPSPLQSALARLPADAEILDCGGWFLPLLEATHVVDLMPYETRRGRLELAPQPGEHFRRETWHQADFLAPEFRLPFPDKFFAFSHCSQTIEDLADPEPLLRELNRVSRAGVLISPSRLSEQTAGSSDRMTGRQGHPHHHWIAETESGRAILSRKTDSLAGAWWQTAIPLRTMERLKSSAPSADIWSFVWEGRLEWTVVRGAAARARAVDFARRTRGGPAGLVTDFFLRSLRRAKHAATHRQARHAGDWWNDMVELSRPYNRLP